MSPYNQVAIECGRYEAVEVEVRGSGQLSTSSMRHPCAVIASCKNQRFCAKIARRTSFLARTPLKELTL
jgi:hypothetical protein